MRRLFAFVHRCGKVELLVTSTSLRTNDLAAVLALSACSRAAAAIATAATELTEDGVLTERMTAVLVKHMLVHFSGLENEFEQLLRPTDLEAGLGELASRRRSTS